MTAAPLECLGCCADCHDDGRAEGRREMLWLMAVGAGCAEVIWRHWANVYANRMWTAASLEKRAMSRYAGYVSEEAMRALGIEP